MDISDPRFPGALDRWITREPEYEEERCRRCKCRLFEDSPRDICEDCYLEEMDDLSEREEEGDD